MILFYWFYLFLGCFVFNIYEQDYYYLFSFMKRTRPKSYCVVCACFLLAPFVCAVIVFLIRKDLSSINEKIRTRLLKELNKRSPHQTVEELEHAITQH